MTKIIFLLLVTICQIQNLGGEIERKRKDIEGSGSIQGSFDDTSILNDLLNLPIKLPRKVLTFTSTIGKNILSLDRRALEIPISGSRALVNHVGNIFESIITRIVNLILEIHSINADLVAGVIRGIQGFIAWIVTRIVSLNIFGLKTGESIVGFISERIGSLIGSILKIIVWILIQINKIVQGGVKLFHFRDILNLPVVKQIVSLYSDIGKKVVRFIYSQFLKIGKFIDMLIYKNRDFFYPIFKKILNIFLSFTNFINQLADEGGNEGGYAEMKESNSGKWTADDGYQGNAGSNSNSKSQESYPESWIVNSLGGDESKFEGVELGSGSAESKSDVLSSGTGINSDSSSSAIGTSREHSSTGNGGFSLNELLEGENWLDSGSSTESVAA